MGWGIEGEHVKIVLAFKFRIKLLRLTLVKKL